MTTFWVTAYILVWPAIVLGVLALLCTAIIRDVAKARREGSEIV